MSALRSLHARLTLVFLAILLALGASVLEVARTGAERRSLEVTQRLNEPVARYMVETVDFVGPEGLRGGALAELAPHVMTINPSVRVYLLDADGDVVAQASSLNTIAPKRVDLDPVRRFLAPDARYPLLGDDPLGDAPRPFSAWPVERDGATVGYVYATLAGADDATLAEALGASGATRELVALLGGALAFAALAGAAVFFTMTRRLRALTRRVESDPDAAPRGRRAAGARPSTRRDEIDELAHAYGSMTERLRAQYARLEESDADRRALVASVSHDLRTPLTTLAGYLETLELGDGTLGPDERRRCLALAHRHARVLRARVDQLFELSRLSADGARVVPERFSLRELAHDCLQDFAPLAAERGARLHVGVDADGPDDGFAIDADIALVQRMLENLVDNALRHVAPGGRVEVALARGPGDRVRLEVRDDGSGMSAEVAGRAFDPAFSAASDGRGRGGLGLAIVARIVALHGGRIGLRSREGVGTRFAIELPGAVRAKAADAPRAASRASRAGTARRRVPARSPALAPRRGEGAPGRPVETAPVGGGR